MEPEWRQSDASRMARDLEASQRESEYVARISELEGTLQKVARLQKKASAERQQKEQDYRDEIARLEQRVWQSQAPGLEQAPGDVALAESRRREQEYLDRIGDLNKQISELQKAPLIIQSLLTEAAKKDEERKQEIGRLKVALLHHPAAVQDGLEQEHLAQAGGSDQVPDSQKTISHSDPDGPARHQNASHPELEAEVDRLRRQLKSRDSELQDVTAQLEAEVDRLRRQLKSRDSELQDVTSQYERCWSELEARRAKSPQRSQKLDTRKASPEDPPGSPVMDEWRRQLALFDPAGLSGDMAQAQFRRLLELDLEVGARVQRRPELLAAVQAARAVKAEQLRRDAHYAVVDVERKAIESSPARTGATASPSAESTMLPSSTAGFQTPGPATPKSPARPSHSSPVGQAVIPPFPVAPAPPGSSPVGAASPQQPRGASRLPAGVSTAPQPHAAPAHEMLRRASPVPRAAEPLGGDARCIAVASPRPSRTVSREGSLETKRLSAPAGQLPHANAYSGRLVAVGQQPEVARGARTPSPMRIVANPPPHRAIGGSRPGVVPVGHASVVRFGTGENVVPEQAVFQATAMAQQQQLPMQQDLSRMASPARVYGAGPGAESCGGVGRSPMQRSSSIAAPTYLHSMLREVSFP